jgi:spermidine synthase
MNRKTAWLLLVVFISGMTSLGIELTASRFIGNYFGSALPVWAAIIGMVLVYLTIGYLLGGRLADRNPSEGYLYRITMWAGFLSGLIPFVANPILQFATIGIREVLANVFVGSLLGVILLLSVPTVLLGCVSPFAIRLQTRSVESTGNTAGALYALSTMGSILGTFLPVLVLIPTIGTRNTFLFFSFALMIPSLIGLLVHNGRRAWLHGLLLLIILALMLLVPRSVVRAAEAGELVYETESAYNYIQVVQVDDNRYLMLNEGNAVHSIYNPNQLLTHGEWDYFAVAPYFNKSYDPAELKRVAVIGLAAGTVPRQLTAIYGPITIDGVEIDPTIADVGRRYFHMGDLPNLNVIIQDGRYFMRTTEEMYDLIGVDAYHQPYIPAQLTTVEFFQEAYDHLNDRGVILLNAGRTATDFRLLNALGATMQQVFPSVYTIDIPDQEGWSVINTLIVATKQPTQLANFAANARLLKNDLLKEIAASSIVREFKETGLVFTDDKAPVEFVTDQMILGYALGQ